MTTATSPHVVVFGQGDRNMQGSGMCDLGEPPINHRFGVPFGVCVGARSGVSFRSPTEGRCYDGQDNTHVNANAGQTWRNSPDTGLGERLLAEYSSHNAPLRSTPHRPTLPCASKVASAAEPFGDDPEEGEYSNTSACDSEGVGGCSVGEVNQPEHHHQPHPQPPWATIQFFDSGQRSTLSQHSCKYPC